MTTAQFAKLVNDSLYSVIDLNGKSVTGGGVINITRPINIKDSIGTGVINGDLNITAGSKAVILIGDNAKPLNITGNLTISAQNANVFSFAKVTGRTDIKDLSTETMKNVNVTEMMKPLKTLTDIGPKVASSPEEKQAAEYIKAQFEAMGSYEVSVQEFGYENNVAYLKSVGENVQTINVRAGSKSIITTEDGITGKVVRCGDGMEKEDFSESVKDNIVLIETTAETKNQASYDIVLKNAEEAGAKAVLFQNIDWKIFSASTSATESKIPFATLNKDAGDAIAEDTILNFKINKYTKSQNVIATRKANKTNNTGNIVIVTAHYDSVPTAPGANDNNSGVVALLEIAKIMQELPLDTEVRFVAFGSEEVGLKGSRYYVSQLSEDEKSRVIGNFNMDMVATAGATQTTLFVNVYDGEDNFVAKSAKVAAGKLGVLNLLRAPFKRGASDHVPFNEAGIDAANFIYRDPDTVALEEWYHQPYDTIEQNINQQRFEMATKIVGISVYDAILKNNPLLNK